MKDFEKSLSLLKAVALVFSSHKKELTTLDQITNLFLKE